MAVRGCFVQAERLKDSILEQRAHWRLNGPVTDSHVQRLIESDEASAEHGTRGVVLDRRRFGDDSDSDVDLDGL